MSIDKEEVIEYFRKMLDVMFPDEVEEEEEAEEIAPPKKRRRSKKKTSRSTRKRAAVEEDEEDEEEEVPAVSLNQVRKAMRTYSNEYGKDAAREILEPYGVKTLSALEPDDYESVLRDIEDAS